MPENQETRAALEQQLDRLNQGIQYIRGLIDAERNGPSPVNPVSDAAQNEAGLDGEIAAAKKAILEHKALIIEKTARYDALAGEEKNDSWSLLTRQLEPNTQAVIRLQLEIGALEHQKFAAFLEKEQEEIRAGLSGGPVLDSQGEDPRLSAAYAEKNEIEYRLNQLKTI
ncbi:hypothetical protein [Mucilaginibacter sp.]|uniref:hypothetical protein n=1 Tax=Mucilaginibacter sp. TaxID=1882438 RepID=UPI0032669787